MKNNKKKSEHKNYIRDGAPIPTNEQISFNMSSIKGKDTKPEIIIRKALWKYGIRGYRRHWKKAPGRPDIAFVKKNLLFLFMVVFGIDVLYVIHLCPKVTRDFGNKNSKQMLKEIR